MKNLEKNVFLGENTERLLKELKKEISASFGIEDAKVDSLIRNETTINSLKELKSELQHERELTEQDYIEFFDKINEIRKILKYSSKIELENLKEKVEETKPNFSTILERKLPRKLVKKAQNPEKLHEHILGANLGIANSLVAISETVFKIGVGIVKTPYDLYLLASKKGELESIKEV